MRKIFLLIGMLASIAMLPSAVVANGKGSSYRHFGHRSSVQLRAGSGKRVHRGLHRGRYGGRRLGRGQRIKHIRSGYRFGSKRRLVRQHRLGRSHGVRRDGLHRPGRVRVRRDHRPYAVVHRLSPRRGPAQQSVRRHYGGLKILKGGRPATVVVNSQRIRRSHVHRY